MMTALEILWAMSMGGLLVSAFAFTKDYAHMRATYEDEAEERRRYEQDIDFAAERLRAVLELMCDSDENREAANELDKLIDELEGVYSSPARTIQYLQGSAS